MQNVDLKVKGDVLTIKIDLTKTVGPSRSGKTIIVGTTAGNYRVADNLYLGLNLYRYVQDKGNGDA